MVKKSGGGNSLMMYDEAGHLIGEYSTTGAVTQETIWLGDIPVATIRPNGSAYDIFYIHTDQINSPRVVSRPSDNKLRWRWDWTSPFGSGAPNENPASLGTFTLNLRFPGQFLMSETGNKQNWFRDYDGTATRYLQSDPIGLIGGGNTYGYVSQNPLSWVDPFGLVEGSPANVARRAAIDRIARSYAGSTAWAFLQIGAAFVAHCGPRQYRRQFSARRF
ncbi:MAG: RHS repeat-associated core domain-containing protein [Steroidobacteraceae bacterium]